jgi:hypothetical protein
MTQTQLEQIVVDVALTAEIREAGGGDVRLLLPLLREDARTIWSKPDFVFKVHQLVETYRHHPTYGAAFHRKRSSTLAWATGYPSIITRAIDALAPIRTRCTALLSQWWNQLARQQIEPVEPVKSAAAPIYQPPVRERVVSQCGYTGVAQVRCIDGHLELVHTVCPSCLGAQANKGHAFDL